MICFGLGLAEKLNGVPAYVTSFLDTDPGIGEEISLIWDVKRDGWDAEREWAVVT